MKFNEIENTLNTTRICGGDVFKNAIAISTLVYADKFPSAIILVNREVYQDAFVAASLIHFPRNAPILFTYTNYIPKITIQQILKLRPKGINGAQVFLVGRISYNVEQQIIMLGLRVKRISGKNFLQTSTEIAKYLNFPKNIMIVSGEDYREGMCACAWAAHMGEPILFSSKDYLPSYTRSIIENTENPSIYIIGSTKTISNKVEDEIRGLNVKFVDRISGNTPYEVAVNFSKYKSPDGKFGWGRDYRDGHAFTFTSIGNPFNSAASSPFAHLGKHSPMLVVHKNKLPEITRKYIESVKPLPLQEPHPPFMHGWIIGCNDTISLKAQIEIEKTLSIDESHMVM